MSDKVPFQQEVGRKLSLWEKEFEDAKSKLENVSGNEKDNLERQIQELERNILEAKAKLKRMQKESGSSVDTKEGFDQGLKEIKQKFGGMG